MRRIVRYLPILDWARSYDRPTLTADLVAAVIVTIMLIPQSLAYALLAGLPPEMGLYASILPLVLYAIFGTSRALSVGPVAVVSLMTASAISEIALPGSAAYAAAATTLAFISGFLLTIMGVLRLGFLANFLSHPVIAGFIAATGILIAAGQLKYFLGIPVSGHNLIELVLSMAGGISDTSLIALLVGLPTAAFLFWSRKGLKPLLEVIGVPTGLAGLISRSGPAFAVVVTTALTFLLHLADDGLAIVGDVPGGLPPLVLPGLEPDMLLDLAGAAVLISVIGFVESVSIAQTLAAKKRQRIEPDQELVGLGMANLGASFSGGYPVTGGFARSVVNFDAGAATPAAGAFTAIGIAVVAATLTPLLYFLPKVTLAATILVAVLSLVDLAVLKRTWRYSRADFAAVLMTILLTLIVGVEAGVAAGVALSLVLFLYRTSRPHIAVVGCVPGTQHFRNVKRHKVETDPAILSIRVDESLYFANARFLEDFIYAGVAGNKDVRHVILMCSAVNVIDSSALESLIAINARLQDLGVRFHLSEVKGPVMDQLQKTNFLGTLTGHVYLSQFEAFQTVRAMDRPA